MKLIPSAISVQKLKTSILPLLIIVLAWAIFILPSALNPSIFYLDDPSSLRIAKSLATDPHFPRPDAFSGRYFPFYWLYYGLLFKLFGVDLSIFYFIQAVFFLCSLVLTYQIVKKLTSSNTSGILAALLALTASPVAENAYTLSKAEPKILLYVLAGIYLSIIYIEKNGSKRVFCSWATCISIASLAFIATLTKETAAIFLLFTFSCLFFTIFYNQVLRPSCRLNVRPCLIVFLISSVSILSARTLFYILRPVNGLSLYTSFKIDLPLVLLNLKFYLLQQPDIVAEAIAATVLTILYLLKRHESCPRHRITVTSIFLTGLVYLAGQLVWRWPTGYYLLLPAFFFAIVAVTTIHSFVNVPRLKIIAYTASALLLVSRIYSIPYFSYIASIQKSQSVIYSEAIENYVLKAKSGERLVVEEWPFYAEPIVQSNHLIHDLFGRDDLQVVGVRDILDNTPADADTIKLYNITAIPDKSSRAPRKNDFVLALPGTTQSYWFLRGVSPSTNDRGSVYKTNSYKLQSIADSRVERQYLGFKSTFSLPEIQTFSKSFKLYQVLNPWPEFDWDGKWSDGWISDKAKCTIHIPVPGKIYHLKCSAQGNLVPLALTIKRDAKVIIQTTLKKSGPFDFELPLASADESKAVSIQFNVNKTFNPKKLGISTDDRNLGLIIEIK